jgi:hypothetical protein
MRTSSKLTVSKLLPRRIGLPHASPDSHNSVALPIALSSPSGDTPSASWSTGEVPTFAEENGQMGHQDRAMLTARLFATGESSA